MRYRDILLRYSVHLETARSVAIILLLQEGRRATYIMQKTATDNR